ncbi:PREDICTED: synaptonemal complex protein 1-like [Rhagoletis zephyria]|uniref:synaptonemal complex protein 1-like n=1 Tax=Rhagoletis zephyria TaxID=28612 RepID=UPI00081126B8|nr:PREDICTED: synaptonemal complex protein 1-like [Rhagoletis zephyria]
MNRNSQNLEFTQKLSAKPGECLERRSHPYFKLTRPTCASGGDMATASESLPCNSKNSSYQSLSYKSDPSEEQSEDAIQIEDSQAINAATSDVSNSLELRSSCHATGKRKSKHCEVASKLKAELSKYKKELKEYNNTTKDLEEKYMKINFELNEMQRKHDRFVANRKCKKETNAYSDSSSSSSTGSEFSLKRKYTQIFHRGSSFMTMLPPDCTTSNENIENECTMQAEGVAAVTLRKRKLTSASEYSSLRLQNSQMPQKRTSKRKSLNKENEAPHHPITRATEKFNPRDQAAGLKDIYNVLKNVLDNNQKTHSLSKSADLKAMQSTIVNLQNEQMQFRNIIKQQHNCLQDYHTRCIKAQHIMQVQQIEIEKLNSNNHQLETEISTGIDQLRHKIDSKLRDVSHLPQIVRDEQSKCEKLHKENNALAERVRSLQVEASQLKIKMEELARRKVMTINRLKAADRDLKIFKNYNTALKHEKQKLAEELQKVKDQLDSVQNTNKRTLARQREQTEKQRRDLQKRVFELELKLNRSQNSTTSLIQERDSLIAELQTQLNTLVHNFEVSQKHIRVLRRHIYAMSGGNVRCPNLFNENM